MHQSRLSLMRARQILVGLRALLVIVLTATAWASPRLAMWQKAVVLVLAGFVLLVPLKRLFFAVRASNDNSTN